MAIKIQDLRYIRRSRSEVAVLRELVSFQRCKTIHPSEFWLAQMTRLSESSVRRALVKLAKAGLISYVKHKRDFRGPLRPTNTYTLHPERIQGLIDAGREVVNKALGEYYKKAGSPRHIRKRPVKLTGQSSGKPVKSTGYTTGQNDPQDVSLSKESLPPDKGGDFEPPYEEFGEESSDELSWGDLCEMEKLHWEETDTNDNPYVESSSNEPQQSSSNREVIGPTPSPHSAAPPSPPRGTFAWACQVTLPYRTQPEEFRQEEWDELCYGYGNTEVADALELFLKYDGSAKGRPLGSFSFLSGEYVKRAIELRAAGNDGL